MLPRWLTSTKWNLPTYNKRSKRGKNRNHFPGVFVAKCQSAVGIGQMSDTEILDDHFDIAHDSCCPLSQGQAWTKGTLISKERVSRKPMAAPILARHLRHLLIDNLATLPSSKPSLRSKLWHNCIALKKKHGSHCAGPHPQTMAALESWHLALWSPRN